MTSTYNDIHQTAIVDKKAHMGYDNYVGPYCVINAGVRMGNGNRFESHVSVGSMPEHKKYWRFNRDDLPGVVIGNNNTFREFTTINRGTIKDTTIGSDCIMLRGSHLSHDSVLEDSVVVSCNVLIGGESYVCRQANLGLGCILHQHSFVGRGVMLGMGTIVPRGRELLPFTVYVGIPARKLRMNQFIIEHDKLSKDDILSEAIYYRRRLKEFKK